MNIEKYFEFEDKYALSERIIIGEHYWEYCRIFMFFFVQSLYDETTNIIDFNPPKPSRKLSFKLLKKYALVKIKSCDVLFVSDPRRFRIGDSYMSIFCDPISNSISDEYESLIIEEPSWVAKYDSFPPHFTPTSNDNVLYVDVYEHLFLIKKWLFTRLKKSKTAAIKAEIKYLIKIIKKEFGVDVSFTLNEFTDIILYTVLMKKTYSKLIDKINPKILLNAYRPTYFKTLLIGICKEKDIPVVELQHGSINKNEPMNKKMYHKANEKYLADYIFCYGHKLVKTYFMVTDKIKYVGYPFLEYIQALNLPKPQMMQSGIRYILIISQSTIGEQLAEFASTLSELLVSRSEYAIIFKYHPNEIGRNYSCLNKQNIIQIKDLDNYVTQFQKYAYCQIGVYSTAVYEGLKFRLPTIIIDNLYAADTLIENISHIKNGIYYVKSASEVFDIIDVLKQSSHEDISTLWEDNAIQNSKLEIRKIIESRKK